MYVYHGHYHILEAVKFEIISRLRLMGCGKCFEIIKKCSLKKLLRFIKFLLKKKKIVVSFLFLISTNRFSSNRTENSEF